MALEFQETVEGACSQEWPHAVIIVAEHRLRQQRLLRCCIHGAERATPSRQSTEAGNSARSAARSSREKGLAADRCCRRSRLPADPRFEIRAGHEEARSLGTARRLQGPGTATGGIR